MWISTSNDPKIFSLLWQKRDETKKYEHLRTQINSLEETLQHHCPAPLQKYFADYETSPNFPSVEGESFRFVANFPILFLSDYRESDQWIGLADL